MGLSSSPLTYWIFERKTYRSILLEPVWKCFTSILVIPLIRIKISLYHSIYSPFLKPTTPYFYILYQEHFNIKKLIEKQPREKNIIVFEFLDLTINLSTFLLINLCTLKDFLHGIQRKCSRENRPLDPIHFPPRMYFCQS